MFLTDCPAVSAELGFGAPRSVFFAKQESIGAQGRAVTSPARRWVRLGPGPRNVLQFGSWVWESGLGLLICRARNVVTIPRGVVISQRPRARDCSQPSTGSSPKARTTFGLLP